MEIRISYKRNLFHSDENIWVSDEEGGGVSDETGSPMGLR